MEPFPYAGGLRFSSESEDLPPFASVENFDTFGLLDVAPPEQVHLPTLPLIRDQTDLSNPTWDIPCCVSMALIQAMESLDDRNPPSVTLSPLFHYYFLNTGNPGGASILDGILLAVDRGVCRLDLHNPQMATPFAQQAPSNIAEVDSQNHRVANLDPITYQGGYARLYADNGDQWIQFLAAGCPVIIGFWMTEAYAALRQSSTHGSTNGLARHGGHAVVCLGYTHSHRCFLMKDSRGAKFGSGGFWWLPFDRLAEGFIPEAWALCQITY